MLHGTYFIPVRYYFLDHIYVSRLIRYCSARDGQVNGLMIKVGARNVE